MATIRTAIVERINIATFNAEHEGSELFLKSDEGAADAASRARVPVAGGRRYKASVDSGPEAPSSPPK